MVTTHHRTNGEPAPFPCREIIRGRPRYRKPPPFPDGGVALFFWLWSLACVDDVLGGHQGYQGHHGAPGRHAGHPSLYVVHVVLVSLHAHYCTDCFVCQHFFNKFVKNFLKTSQIRQFKASGAKTAPERGRKREKRKFFSEIFFRFCPEPWSGRCVFSAGPR